MAALDAQPLAQIGDDQLDAGALRTTSGVER
jgi:hypothetical protein